MVFTNTCPIFGERTDAGLSIGKKKQASLTVLTCSMEISEVKNQRTQLWVCQMCAHHILRSNIEAGCGSSYLGTPTCLVWCWNNVSGNRGGGGEINCSRRACYLRNKYAACWQGINQCYGEVEIHRFHSITAKIPGATPSWAGWNMLNDFHLLHIVGIVCRWSK